ncbi:type 1 fimbrial protein [Providencia rettgeri]|uniref:Type 1 fimbrial protein n=1 Tax=Providencia rettgeri TaxID=587 RepID=A0A939SQR7_PRORE|nr:type 1 fimbrial protein [Providencia rettgeri]
MKKTFVLTLISAMAGIALISGAQAADATLNIESNNKIGGCDISTGTGKDQLVDFSDVTVVKNTVKGSSIDFNLQFQNCADLKGIVSMKGTADTDFAGGELFAIDKGANMSKGVGVKIIAKTTGGEKVQKPVGDTVVWEVFQGLA